MWTTTHATPIPYHTPRPRRCARHSTPNVHSLLDLFRKGGSLQGVVRPGDGRKMGPLTVSPMGLGTWRCVADDVVQQQAHLPLLATMFCTHVPSSWGNQLLWGYDEGMDDELQAVFDLATDRGINLWDTADSYGTHKLLLCN